MSIMDMLAQAGQGAPPPQQGPPPAPGAEDAGSHDDMLRQILDAVRAAAAEAESEQETLALEKISTMVQQLLAQTEKESHDMLGGKLPPGALMKALG